MCHFITIDWLLFFSFQTFDAANDKPLTLDRDYEGFKWFLEPREAAAYINAEHQATIARYADVDTTSMYKSKSMDAKVPTSWNVPEQFVDDDEAIVPDEIRDSFAYQSDVLMYGAGGVDVFSAVKSRGTKRRNIFDLDGEYDDSNCYPCQDTKFMRLESNDNGYSSYEEELGVV